MEKEFCTYEQSLALKELGFNMRCFGSYLQDEFITFSGEEAEQACLDKLIELAKESKQ